MTLLALDIGGANIKAADGLSFARSYPFPLWRLQEQLAHQLHQVLSQGPACDYVVATMTGELADCFPSKREGVVAIVDALVAAGRGRRVGIYMTDGEIVGPSQAKQRYRRAAASNWHVLGRFAARFAGRVNALAVDIGSTTCDVVPIVGGRLAARGMTDTQRLMARELVYAGVERTPVCSIIDAAPYRGQPCPLAREVFATMKDVYLILGDIDEDETDMDTADGRPATKDAAISRLGRCLCADVDEFDQEDGLRMAEAAARSQAKLLAEALQSVAASRELGVAPSVILSGHGDFLFDRTSAVMAHPPKAVFRLGNEIGSAAARCAPAYALAALVRGESAAE